MSKKVELLRILSLTIAIALGFVVQAAAGDGPVVCQLSNAPEVQVEVLPVL